MATVTMDKWATLKMFAPDFDATATYAVGAWVNYGGKLWKCHTAVETADDWTGATNWTEEPITDFFDDVSDIKNDMATEAKQDAAKTVIDDTNTRVKAIQPVANANSANLSTVKAKLDTMEQIFASNRLAYITVRLNPTGSTYTIPESAAAQAELLTGAKVILREQGVDSPFEAAITTLENFSVTFQVYVTDAAQALYSSVGAVLGKSSTVGYATTQSAFRLRNGDNLTIDLTTSEVTGTVVEMCRVQPWSDNPGSDPNVPKKTGVSFLGTRITTSGGTTLHLGHYASDGTTWVDESLTKVVTWKCPDAQSTPEEVIVKATSDEIDRTNWVDLEDRLACLKNAKIATLTCTGASASHEPIPFVRFPKLYTKREKISVNLPIEGEGGVLSDNYVTCLITWFCDTQADANYRTMDAFLQPIRQNDGTYEEVERPYCYISPYPISNVQNLAVVTEGGETVTMSCARVKTGEGREYVPGNKGVTWERVKPLNWTTMSLAVEGETATAIAADYDNRTIGVMGSRHIGFLQNLAYLHFGVNVQGASSSTNPELNIFPGICTSAVQATTNGATDYIRTLGKHTGAANPQAITNSILFCLIEDGLWSSTGTYNMNVSFVTRRTIVTGSDGTVGSNTASAQFLYCKDQKYLKPLSGNSTIDNNSVTEITTAETDSFEGQLKLVYHYDAMAPDVGVPTALYRAMNGNAPAIRDLYFPTNDPLEENINMGACDAWWKVSIPNDIGTFATNKAYAQGSYIIYDGKLYQFTAAHAAGAWTGEDVLVVTNTTVTQRRYYVVALGGNRGDGSSLGFSALHSDNRLSDSVGGRWRARLILY